MRGFLGDLGAILFCNGVLTTCLLVPLFAMEEPPPMAGFGLLGICFGAVLLGEWIVQRFPMD